MGKKWDYDIPPVEVWQECLRVLKPGAFGLVACGTRTQHRMAVNLEDAGFEIRDIVAWVYGSGFPKSLNIGKAIDKTRGETDRELRFCLWMRTTGLNAGKANNILQEVGVISKRGTMAGHFFAQSLSGQPAVATREIFEALKPHFNCDIPDYIEEIVNRVEAEREVIGKKKSSLGGTVCAGERDAKFIEEHRNKIGRAHV